MVKKIWLLRHGQTDFNKSGMVQGSGIDAPINATGQRQAQAFYEKYRAVNFDAFYVSDLIRTHQTISPFLSNGQKPIILTGLREISWGVQEGVAFTPETSTVYQQTCEAWTAGHFDQKIEGGESPLEVASRQKEAFETILERENEKQILVCTHGRAMRIMLCWMLGYPLSMMDHFKHTNTGLYLLNYTGSQFSVELFNETSHLEDA